MRTKDQKKQQTRADRTAQRRSEGKDKCADLQRKAEAAIAALNARLQQGNS